MNLTGPMTWHILLVITVPDLFTSFLQLLQALDADSSGRNMQLANRFQEIDDVTSDDVFTLSLVWSRDQEAANGDHATITSSNSVLRLPSFLFKLRPIY